MNEPIVHNRSPVWHDLPITVLFAELKASLEVLSQAEAEARLQAKNPRIEEAALTGECLVVSREGLSGNRYTLLAIALVLFFQVVFTYARPMQTLFGTTAIDAAAWVRIVTGAFSVFVLIELEKVVFNGGKGRPDR